MYILLININILCLLILTLYEQDKRNVTFKANVASLKIRKLVIKESVDTFLF